MPEMVKLMPEMVMLLPEITCDARKYERTKGQHCPSIASMPLIAVIASSAKHGANIMFQLPTCSGK
jgi:hypothetical protein